jgi:predicted dehydrogenase
VLQDVGLSFEDGNAVLDADAKAVRPDLGPSEPRTNLGFNLGIGRTSRSGLFRRTECGFHEKTCDGNGQREYRRTCPHTEVVGGERYNSHMTLQKPGRREVLTTAVKAAALTAASYSRVLGANDRVLLGVIGTGDRGRHVMGQFLLTNRVDVGAVCDVYANQVDLARQKAPNAKNFSDHRKLLEVKELNAVLIATPDHWHSQTAIDALNAGKDVYVEKPLTLTIEEGPPIVKAARVNNRICQVGMQQRSGQHYLQAKAEYFDTGKLGKITLARTWWHGNTYHLRRAPESLQQQPSNLDWARFLGPLKWRDYDPQQFFNWRAYLDFGGGQVTDLFTHWIDVVHMMLGREIPTSAVAAGGVYHYKDGRTAPDTINVLLEYNQEFTATFEATLAPGIRGAAVEICGTNGKLYIDRSRFEFLAAERGAQPVVVQAPPHDMTLDHVKNFLDCVVSRKLPNGDVLIGHRSAQASHLGNIAYLQKRRLSFDPVREEILPL